MSMLASGSASGVRADGGSVYLHMAIICAIVAFTGFAPTYWLPLASGNLNVKPIFHVHAVVFFSWSMFLVLQTWLAASRRIELHRTMGLVGVSLATAMTIIGVLSVIGQMQAARALGMSEAGLAFSIVPLGGIGFFAAVFGFAVANVRRPEWHKRLMIFAAVSILDAPIARWFIVALAPPGAVGPPPVGVDLGPSLVALLLLAYPLFCDWRTRGSPHPAYLWAGSAFIALKLLQSPISETAAWRAIASSILALAG